MKLKPNTSTFIYVYTDCSIFPSPSFLIHSPVYFLGWWILTVIFSRLHPTSHKHGISQVEPRFCLLLHSHFIAFEPCGIIKGCLVCVAYFYLIPGKILWYTVFWDNKKSHLGPCCYANGLSWGRKCVCVCVSAPQKSMGAEQWACDSLPSFQKLNIFLSPLKWDAKTCWSYKFVLNTTFQLVPVTAFNTIVHRKSA